MHEPLGGKIGSSKLVLSHREITWLSYGSTCSFQLLTQCRLWSKVLDAIPHCPCECLDAKT